jgi:glycine oxidase
MTRVGIVGAGIIGLTIAWECQRRGHDVTVADPAPGRGASHVAAGMLAPVGEAHFGEEPLTELLVAAARAWPGFVAALGEDVGYRTEGTLQVGLTADDVAVLRHLADHQRALGFGVKDMVPQELEPSLNPRARGMLVPGDHRVDPRRVVAALLRRVRVAATLPEVDVTVVAAGTASVAWGLPIRPVKGVVLRLRGPELLRHTIRGHCAGRQVYLVPRDDGEVVVGATSEEAAGAEASAGAVRDLLRAATDLVPDLTEHALAEVCVGHRPGTPDNGPIVGPMRTGLIAATGHYRHGVLAAPLTAQAVADLIEGGPVPEAWRPFIPGRFE